MNDGSLLRWVQPGPPAPNQQPLTRNGILNLDNATVDTILTHYGLMQPLPGDNQLGEKTAALLDLLI